jgi:trans-aconitate methyltransferase
MDFNKEYFQKMYPKDGYIDGDFNAREHAAYLKGLFGLMEQDVKSIVDFGFGKGELLHHVSKAFEAKKVEGLDVSTFAYNNLKKKTFAQGWKLHVCPVHEAPGKAVFDLGLSNSVLQYIEDRHIEATLQRMAEKVKFLYFHVPTKEDYGVLKKVLDFKDPYAKQRSNRFYQEHVAKYFTIVAWGVLESKIHGRKGTPFTDSFYRI